MRFLTLPLVFAAAGVTGWFSTGPSNELPSSTHPLQPDRPARGSRIPADVSGRLRPLRQAGSDAACLRAAVLLASQIPPGDLPRWRAGNFVCFLDDRAELLFNRIITERWIETDAAAAARWLASNEPFQAGGALAAWFRQNPADALAFYQGLPEIRRRVPAFGLIEAVAATDMPAALVLLNDLQGGMTNSQLVCNLARMDRNAIRSFASTLTGKRRMDLLRATAAAWVDDDFRWVVEMMRREGLGPEVFGEISDFGNGGNAGLAVLKHTDLLPDGWLDQIIADSTNITQGCEVEWLKARPDTSGIPADALARIQLQAARYPFWNNDRRDAGLELVAHGDWLTEETRAAIARNLAARWKDDPDAAKAWIETLDGAIRTAADNGFSNMMAERKQDAKKYASNTPEQIIGAIAEDPEAPVLPTNLAWTSDRITDAVRLAEKLPPAKAAPLLPELRYDNQELPDQVAAAIIARGLLEPPVEEGYGRVTLRVQTSAVCSFAARWASREPSQSAAWAAKLPPGQPRLWALKNIALQWNRFSTSEARGWAATLPGDEKAAVLAVLKPSL